MRNARFLSLFLPKSSLLTVPCTVPRFCTLQRLFVERGRVGGYTYIAEMDVFVFYGLPRFSVCFYVESGFSVWIGNYSQSAAIRHRRMGLDQDIDGN